jgi:hypothetical protein
MGKIRQTFQYQKIGGGKKNYLKKKTLVELVYHKG